MVQRIIHFFGREIKGLHEAAYLLAFFAFFSQILGLVRDRLLAMKFGAGIELDIYYAAFRIPDVIFTLTISLVSMSVLIPYLISKSERSREEYDSFSNSIFTALLILSVGLSVIAFIFAPTILQYLFPDFFTQPLLSEKLVMLTRITLLQPILLSISGFYASYVQMYKKFYAYSLSPIIYNVGIILGIVVFYPMVGLSGLAWGVVLGALLHLLIQLAVVVNNGVVPRITRKLDMRAIKDVLQTSLPRTISLTANQIAILILVSLAGLLVTGSISIFTFGYNLQSVPMVIIGASYSIAAFPTLSRLFADGERQQFLQQIIKATQHIIFWSLPVTALFIVLRAQIVRTILGSGAFSWSDTKLVAAALALFSISVLAQSLTLLFARAYYSTGETRKPLQYAVISVVVTIVLAFGLMGLYQLTPQFVYWFEVIMRVDHGPGSAVLMLVLAFAIGQILYAVLLWRSFHREFQCFDAMLAKTARQSLAASIVIALVAYVALQILVSVFDTTTLIGIFMQGFVAGILGIIAGIWVLIVLKNNEIRVVSKTIHSKIWHRKAVIENPLKKQM